MAATKEERWVLLDTDSRALCLRAVFLNIRRLKRHGFDDDVLRAELVCKVCKQAEQLGRRCQWLKVDRRYHSCTLKVVHPSVRLPTGHNLMDQYRVSAHAFVRWLSIDSNDITSGKFMGRTQKGLEVWMRSIVTAGMVLRAERS